MTMNSGSSAKLQVPGLRNVMFQAYNERPKEYEAIFNLKTSKRSYEEDLEFAGLGVMSTKPEGTSVVYSDPTQGGLKRYTHATYGGGYRVTEEAAEDDLYNIVKPTKMSRELGKGARVAGEVLGANVFNNGFTALDGYLKNGTAETLFKTAHTLIGVGGTTFSNTASADLAQASLEAAVISFNKTPDENNVPVIFIPERLLVPPDLLMIARELLGSEFKPYTANNEINAIKQDGLSLVVNHYLTDADSWFVLGRKEDTDLNFFIRRPLKFEYADDFDTGDMKVKGTIRMSAGYGDWRGTYGGLGV